MLLANADMIERQAHKTPTQVKLDDILNWIGIELSQQQQQHVLSERTGRHELEKETKPATVALR